MCSDKLQIFNNKVVCPRCDGNGFIYKARIVELSMSVYICDECDALWQEEKKITVKDFVDSSTFLKNQGIKTKFNIIELGYNWYKNS